MLCRMRIKRGREATPLAWDGLAGPIGYAQYWTRCSWAGRHDRLGPGRGAVDVLSPHLASIVLGAGTPL